MDMRSFMKALSKVMHTAEERVYRHVQRDNIYSRGLPPEGYDAGYAAALRDVDAFIRHGYPNDQRRVWKEALHVT